MRIRIGMSVVAVILSLAVTACVSMGSVGSAGPVTAGAGSAVAISADGSLLAVGNPEVGSVAVFVRSQGDWKSVATLSAEGVPQAAHFGASVAVSEDGQVVFVGAPDQDLGSEAAAGKVYVFEAPERTWLGAGTISKPADTITSMAEEVGARFGASLATSLLGRFLVVGAPGQEDGQGAVYLASRGSAGEVQGVVMRVTQMSALHYPGAKAGDAFGSSVAVSRDGGFIAAGAPGWYGNTGMAFIYKRPDSSKGWDDGPAIKVIKVINPYGNSGDRFAESVALSKGGHRMVVGDPSPRGRSHVFLLTLDWSTAKMSRLVIVGPDDTASMGRSIAMASDAGVIVSGAYKIRSNQGVVVTLKDENGVWDKGYQMRVIAPEGWETGDLGASVAVSADGTELVAGAPRAKGGAGDYLASTIKRDPGRAANAALYASEISEIGASVAISADGKTELVGVPRGSFKLPDCGYVWLYEKTSDGWQYRATLSAGKEAVTGDDFGASLAISADGSVAVVGAPNKSGGALDSYGAGYVFIRPNAGWPKPAGDEDVQVVPDASFSLPKPAGGELFGSSIAISGDGSLIVAGAPGAFHGEGDAECFIRPAGGWTASGSVVGSSLRVATLGLRANDRYGSSVAVAEDGSIIAVGAPGRTITGSVVIARRPPTGWRSGGEITFYAFPREGEKLGVLSHLGKSLAITKDGTNILSGADNSDAATGSVYHINLKPSPDGGIKMTTYTIDTKIDAPFAVGDFARSLAVSGDGTVVLIGSLGAGGVGQLKIVKYPSEGLGGQPHTWNANIEAPIQYGWSVAMSGDGTDVVVGAPFKHGGSGGVERPNLAGVFK